MGAASTASRFWVRLDALGFFVTALELRLYNEGVEKLPAPFGQEGDH